MFLKVFLPYVLGPFVAAPFKKIQKMLILAFVANATFFSDFSLLYIVDFEQPPIYQRHKPVLLEIRNSGQRIKVTDITFTHSKT